MTKILASILQGAYGDYYEQALCLKHLALTNSDITLKLYAASEHRLKELKILDFSFASSFEHWTEMASASIDEVLQFHVRDVEFQQDVYKNLPGRIQNMIDLHVNHTPWNYLKKIIPVKPEHQLLLNQEGQSKVSDILKTSGIDDSVFMKPTIGFLWRHRKNTGAVKPYLQQSAEELVNKYSNVFRRVLNTYDCSVLICGMRVKRNEENFYRVDGKYPEFGLDLPADRCYYLGGLSWAAEVEILNRCSFCVGHPSGFTEALEIRRPGSVMLVDPLPHYLLKLLKYRMPFFGNMTPRGMMELWRFRDSEERLFRRISRRIEGCVTG